MTHPIFFFGGLVLSNLFMTLAWYGHLKSLNTKHWLVAALVSWGIALFEYLIQVPSNRLGYQNYSLEQLKIFQEVITLLVFIPFAIFVMKEKISIHYLMASGCLIAAVVLILQAPRQAA